MLREISGKTHHVITGVCIRTDSKQSRFSVSTDVKFKKLTDGEIDFYVDHFKPYDKAGAYGIQESDMVVAECSNPSLGVGYELAYAESRGIPCHIFYDKSKTQLSAMLTGNPYFVIYPYQTEEELFSLMDKILS